MLATSRRAVRFASLAIACSAIVLTAARPAGAQGKPDFDIRGPRETTLASPPAALPPGQQRALDDLRAAAGGAVEVRWSALTGAPSRLHRRGKPLTLPAKASPQAIANTFLARYRELLGLSPEDMRDLRVARDFRTEHNSAHHLTLQQRVEGRDVFGGGIRINLDSQGRILGVSGEPMPNVNAKVNALNPILSEQDALHQAAVATGIERRRSEKVLGLVYFPRDPSSVRLAWRVYVEDADTPDGYESLIDAVDGTLLWRENRTLYNHIAAHGQVFPSDSPQPHTPKGTLYDDVRDDLPFYGTGFFPHGDPHYDWWAGVTPRDTTTNNNVDAFLDRDNDDAPDAACTSCGDGAARPDAGVAEDFSSALDLSLDPEFYQDAAIINTFYWANRTHDFFYRLGFDEAAGNFQSSNFAFGFSGGDAVLLNVQDGADLADPPYCNANMNTNPTDGNPPRLQMYLCDNTTPIRDSALDAMTLTHEYSHGVHSRLLDLGGRQNPQEGISDYFGLSHLAEAPDPYGGAYGYGGQWARGITSGDGIRSDPYSTDSSIFPRTYADINDASTCQFGTCSVTTGTLCDENGDCPGGETCGSFPACSFDQDCDSPPQPIGDRGPCTVSVHHTGELWANALWIARFNLVEKYGFASGGRTMNQLVIDGMKLSPDDPSMLDGRDWILAADEENNGGANVCLLWDAFARMGMGESALTTGNDDLNPLEAFDVPAECSPVLQVNAPTELGAVCLGGFETETLTIFNTGSGDLIVSSVSRTAGSTDITVDPLPTTPVFVSADAHIDFTVRCEPTTTGAKTATITIESNDTAQPTLDLVYTCTGGSPNLVTTFASGGSFGDVCLGDDKDLELTLHNSGTCPLTVSSISSGLAEFEVGAVQVLPLVIDGGDTVMVPIQFDPAGDAGAEGTNITIVSNDADSPHLLAVTGNSPPAVVDAFIGDLGVFGNVCVESVFKELPFTIQNNGACPLDIDGVTLTGGDVADFSLPVLPGTTTLEPANSVVIPVRFNPTSFLPLLTRTTTVRVSSRTLFATTALADDDTVVTGDAPPPDINVPAATATVEFGNVCADENAEKTIDVCNVGGCNLNVTAAAIVDCPDNDFTIVANPFPSIVSPDFCMGVVVRYTPHNEGEHTCRLRISSNDPDEPDVFVNLHGTTPVDIIDVPESVTFLPEVVSSVDVCETKTPFPISNNGLCPLEIQNIFIETNPEEYGLEGVPSFPILLQSGHVAGAGDLRVIFAPDQPLDRDKSGILRVTYVDDAILGTTANFDAELCGEAVLTGARVLVTNNGTNVDTVDRIQIQRVVGNRNRRPQLDTVAVVQNAPLVHITPGDTVCGDFYYHQEYGTVSNQIQLLPGFYQVTATIRVSNKKYTKTVGFSVNSCDFNPSVIVTFATP